MELEGQTALVTGASTGIGAQFARQLADRGADLIVVARTRSKLDDLAAEIRGAHPGRRVDVVSGDLSRPGAGREVIAAVEELGVPVDLLVNNAGVGSHDRFVDRFVDEDPDALAAQIQLNVGALVDLTAGFLPRMVARGRGGVVNVASTAAFQPVATMAVYAATKAFVLSFTEALWAENRHTGVRVLTLCPGATETEFFARTGKEFLTSGRQEPREVVAAALRALDGRTPTVVPGVANQLSSLAYRFVPRALLARLSGSFVTASGGPEHERAASRA